MPSNSPCPSKDLFLRKLGFPRAKGQKSNLKIAAYCLLFSPRAEMERLSARRTVPQIFIDGQSIGGYDDIRLLDATGGLDRLLGKSTKKTSLLN
jgi:hypothetical protein